MRLALLQGTAFAYVPSVEAFMNLAENRCNATILDFVPQEIYYEKLQLVCFKTLFLYNPYIFRFKVITQIEQETSSSENQI